MAWNGSSGSRSPSTNPPHEAKGLGIHHYAALIAGVVVVGLIFWLIIRGFDEPTGDNVRVTKPTVESAHPTQTVKHTKGKPLTISRKEPDRTKRIAKPELTDENPIVRQKALGRVVKWEHREGPPIFTNRFEALVCEIMTAEPGERFLDLDIEDEFDDSFTESLSHRIAISDDDSENVKFMKQTVIDAKEQVRQLVLQGKSARDIIVEARDELNKIADYRDQLQNAVNDYLVTATDPKETLKFVQEANEILAEYGAMPVDGPDDDETAYELMIHAKEEKVKELDAASAAEQQKE